MSASARDALVGVDIGTSAVKVLACTPTGEQLAASSRAYALRTVPPDRVEQDANEILDGVGEALRETLDALRERGVAIAAIGLSCAMHGVLPLDASNAPLAPLMTWMDGRAAEIAARWRTDATAARLYERTGAPVHAMLPSCKLAWIAEHDPDLRARMQRSVSIKELLVAQWTGKWLIDWGMASATGLFDIHTRAWNDMGLACASIDARLLSEPVAPSTILRAHGERSRALGIADGTPVVLASSDGALANLGCGAVTADRWALTFGTSGALRAVSPRIALDPHGRTFCYAFDDEAWIVGGATNSAGAVLARIFALVLADIPATERNARAEELAAKAAAGARGLVVAPFLGGERAPYWDRNLRGAIVGLGLEHERGDLVRAAYEGTVFALASLGDLLAEGDARRHTLHLSGGLTASPFVRQMIADVFGSTAVRGHPDEASAYGAALFAGLVIGAIADARAAAETVVSESVNEPDPAATQRYVAIRRNWQRVVDTLRSL